MIFAGFNLLLLRVMKSAMVIIFFVALWERSFVIAVGTLANLFISYLPAFTDRQGHEHPPWTLNFWVTLSLFLHTLGFSFGFYHTPGWLWWDELTHALGSAVVGMIAFHLVFTLSFLGKVVMSVPMTGLFIFLTGMGIGGIWEILEFYSDTWFNTHTQISLAETIRDLQFDFIGALLISLAAMRYVYSKRREKEQREKTKH